MRKGTRATRINRGPQPLVITDADVARALCPVVAVAPRDHAAGRVERRGQVVRAALRAEIHCQPRLVRVGEIAEQRPEAAARREGGGRGGARDGTVGRVRGASKYADDRKRGTETRALARGLRVSIPIATIAAAGSSLLSLISSAVRCSLCLFFDVSSRAPCPVVRPDDGQLGRGGRAVVVADHPHTPQRALLEMLWVFPHAAHVTREGVLLGLVVLCTCARRAEGSGRRRVSVALACPPVRRTRRGATNERCATTAVAAPPPLAAATATMIDTKTAIPSRASATARFRSMRVAFNESKLTALLGAGWSGA